MEKSNRPTVLTLIWVIMLVSQVIFSSIARRGVPRIRDLAVDPAGENAQSSRPVPSCDNHSTSSESAV